MDFKAFFAIATSSGVHAGNTPFDYQERLALQRPTAGRQGMSRNEV